MCSKNPNSIRGQPPPVDSLASASARAARLAEALGLTRWALSISYDGGMAIAFVVAM
jgi:hypothetical protein